MPSAKPNRAAAEDANVLAACAAMQRAIDRIRAMPAPRDFLQSYPGVAFLNAAYDLTGADVLYDMANENLAALRAESELAA